MGKLNPDKGDFRAALEGLIDVTFEAFHGNVRHTSRVIAESMEEDTEVDFGQEIAAFCTRAGRDTARAVKAAQEFLDRMGSSKPDTQAKPLATAAPASATGGAAICDPYQETFGPFRTADAVQPQALRRRGDVAPSITSDRIQITPPNVSRNPTKLQIQVVDCRGVARGLYVGTFRVGTEEFPYNIYVDPR